MKYFIAINENNEVISTVSGEEGWEGLIEVEKSEFEKIDFSKSDYSFVNEMITERARENVEEVACQILADEPLVDVNELLELNKKLTKIISQLEARNEITSSEGEQDK